MQRGGMEIGSHSLTHPVLSQVGPDELRQQISGSKATLETRLGCEVNAFSYPAGEAVAVTSEVTEQVRAAGYRFGVSYVNGTNRLNASLDRYTMKRLRVDGLGEREFRMRLAAPTL
jgi:peptidoglycan/xylan/chitin deacetylase (PgdA/CDA1 family)